MRPTRRLAMSTVLVIGTSLVLALPASTNNIPTTGTRIAILNPAPLEFPANSPFHVEQGLFCTVPAELNGCINAGTHFDLYLDGVRQPSVVDMDLLEGPPKTLRKFNLTNYPNGLVGVHTFTGEFFFNGELTGTFQRTITFN